MLADHAATAEAAAGGAVIVLRGISGVGKSALARYWLSRQSQQFGDGLLYADLAASPAGAGGLAEVLAGFLRAFGLPSVSLPDPVDQRAALWRSVTAELAVALLVEDPRAVADVEVLRPSSPRSLTVITTRERRLTGLVAAGTYVLTVPPLDEAAAIELLCRHLRPHGIATGQAHLRRTAHGCAGHPLALCLTAARLIAHADHPPNVTPTAPHRDQSLVEVSPMDFEPPVEANLDGILEELPPDLAHLDRSLGRIPGPTFSVACAAAAAGTDLDTAGRGLQALRQHYLVDTDDLPPDAEHPHADASDEGEPATRSGHHHYSDNADEDRGDRAERGDEAHIRYRFHHSAVRLHAALASHPVIHPDYQASEDRIEAFYLAHTRHVAHTLMRTRRVLPDPLVASTTAVSLLPGLDDYDTALVWQDREAANAATVVAWAADRDRDAVAIATADALQAWVIIRGATAFGRDVDRTALTAARHAGDVNAELTLRKRITRATAKLGEVDTARQCAQALIADARRAGNRRAEASAIKTRSVVARYAHDHEAALADLLLTVAILEDIDNDRALALALIDTATELADVADTPRIAEARGYLHRACALLAELKPEPDRYNHARGLITLARLEHPTNPDTAAVLLSTALISMRDSRADPQQSLIHDLLAQAAHARGDAAAATDHAARAHLLRHPPSPTNPGTA